MTDFRSNVYKYKPRYADYDSPQKFDAIRGIIMTRLKQHPNAICSYSGGSDSDILIHLIESTRQMINLPKVDYCFFETGLEMEATRRHVREVAEQFGVKISMNRPKKNIVLATREFGQPFISKIMSAGLEGWQKNKIPLEIHEEFLQAEDKAAKRKELSERYPNCEQTINFIACCNSQGEPRPNIQLVINSSKWMLDFIKENPPQFKISAKCCEYCKKKVAHSIQKGYEMVITGERRDEGGMRSVPKSEEWYEAGNTMCFSENGDGTFRFKPLYYVSDKDKEWYKNYYNVKYSDAYEVYGLVRTGCCGCPISYRAVEDLKLIEKHEPYVVKAAWNIFGDSYRYRQAYNKYKEERTEREKQIPGQIDIFDLPEFLP